MTGCIDDNAIAALLDHDLPPAERAVLTAHIDTCDACRALVAETARLEDPDGPRVLVPGTTLGRYVVLETVGAGAMGVVYAAYDPELGRKIALKLLRPDPLDVSGSTSARGRLLREAQALAKLAHPHVISIHDVGTLDGEIFLAMEFVERGTLGEWLAREPRDWRAILGIMRQVGEGLAAAHAAGLVHRDLKPDNVLVGADDRARVTDFGLSRGVGDVDDTGGAAPATSLTMTGAVMGTPAYMAPEQLAGRGAGESTDQFSFCVTFYEALFGERPYAATSTGTRSAPKRGAPAWLRGIIERGLQREPSARFPSLRALLDALDRGPLLSPGRLALGAAVMLTIVAIAVAASRSEPAKCTGADAAWAGAWDPAAVRAAFATSGRAAAAATADRVNEIVDDDGAEWRASHREVCRATSVRGEQSAEMLDQRMRCLATRRGEVAALGRLLANADAELVDRAVAAALALPWPSACMNARDTALPARAETRAQIDKLSTSLAEATALEYTGAYERSVATAQAALAQARVVAYGPLTARLLLAVGKASTGNHDLVSAEAALHEAASIALEIGDSAVAADAWTSLVRVVGFFNSKPAEARIWDRYAEGAIVKLGGDDEREATRLRALATVAWRREGKFDEARALITRARPLYDASHGPRYEFQVASCDEGIAGIDFDSGKAADALVLHTRTAAVRERIFGPDHPSVATADINRGEDLTMLGRTDEGIPLIRRAIEILAPAHMRGGDAYAHHRLAAALRVKHDYAGALVEDELSIAGNALAMEQGNYWESWGLTGKGLDLLGLGRDADAIAPLEKALAERATDRIAIEVAETKFALARAKHDRARAIEARDVLAPDAARFGAWYADLEAEIVAWLAKL